MIASERSKKLLHQLRNKEMSLTDFLLECAYWACAEGFDELKPKPYPVRPPKATELENLPIKTKLDLDWNKTCIEYPEVKLYYDQMSEVKRWNSGCRDWLKELLNYIPVGDYPTREKVNKRLLEFDEINDTPLVNTIKKVFDVQPAY